MRRGIRLLSACCPTRMTTSKRSSTGSTTRSVSSSPTVSPAGQPAGARFEGNLLWHQSWALDYLAFADAVYKVDTAKPGVRKISTPPPGDVIQRVARWQPENKGDALVFVLTRLLNWLERYLNKDRDRPVSIPLAQTAKP